MPVIERKLTDFRAHYNAARSHASLDGRTPSIDPRENTSVQDAPPSTIADSDDLRDDSSADTDPALPLIIGANATLLTPLSVSQLSVTGPESLTGSAAVVAERVSVARADPLATAVAGRACPLG